MPSAQAKVDTDLTTALILLFDGREPKEIAEAIVTATGNNYWMLVNQLDETVHNVCMYSQDASSMREKVGEWGDASSDNYELAPHITDHMIFEELLTIQLPDSLFDSMQYAWDELFGEWKDKGWIVESPRVEEVPTDQNP